MRYMIRTKEGREFYVDAEGPDDAVHRANDQYNVKAADVAEVEEAPNIERNDRER